jgi:ferric-dicitrate binding protein FerR (iron transport regulator)
MQSNSLRALFAVAALSATSVFAATPVIGVASAFGMFSVNNVGMAGTANILDGSQLKTDASTSEVTLRNGSTVLLATKSSGQLFANSFVLTSGAAKIDNLGKYVVQGDRYHVLADDPKSQIAVRLNEGTFDVAAVRGAVRVLDGSGALLTHITEGTSASFKAGANNPSTDPDSGGQTPTGATYKKGFAAWWLAVFAGAGAGIGVAAYYGTNHTGSSTTIPTSGP